MKGTREKKQLRLLPEILPAPAPPNDVGSPRQRVLARASRLGALAAAIASAQTGCSGEQASGTTPPIIDIPGTSATGGAIVSTGPATATPTNSQTATNTPELPTGYAVVDPMPPPAACMGVAPTIKATATWISKKGGGLVLELKLFRPSRADASYVTNETPFVWRGKLLSQQLNVDSVTVLLDRDGSAAMMGVRVATSCSQGSAHVQIELDVTSLPHLGSTVPATLQDTW